MGICAAMFFFSVWNWGLAIIGYTTIEFWAVRLDPSDPRHIAPNENNLIGNRSYMKNLETVFGTRNVFLMLLPSIRPLADLSTLDDIYL
jgi:hypothetical protein